MALHKDLTGADLHVNKLHADTHVVAGTDPLVLAESQVTALITDLAAKKTNNVSVTDKVLGRVAAGAGTIEEIACTAAGRALLDDADAAAQRGTLGGVVVGPASATDNAIVRFDAATGKLVQDSLSTINDGGDLTSRALRGKEFSIDDNSAISFSLVFSSAVLVISTIYGNVCRMVHVRPSTPTTTAMDTPTGSILDVTTGVLTGTTGTAGHTTVSCHTDGKVYLENRIGGNTVVEVLLLAVVD